MKLNKGDKLYRAHISNIGVGFSEYTITEVYPDGSAWLEDEYENEEYEDFEDIELHYNKTKVEAIDKLIKMFERYIENTTIDKYGNMCQTYIKDYEKKIKMLKDEQEKHNGPRNN